MTKTGRLMVVQWFPLIIHISDFYFLDLQTPWKCKKAIFSTSKSDVIVCGSLAVFRFIRRIQEKNLVNLGSCRKCPCKWGFCPRVWLLNFKMKGKIMKIRRAPIPSIFEYDYISAHIWYERKWGFPRGMQIDFNFRAFGTIWEFLPLEEKGS